MDKALELADELLYRYADEGGNFYGDDIHKDVIEMLRQQQAEIEALKEKVDELAGYKASYENCHRACNGYGMN